VAALIIVYYYVGPAPLMAYLALYLLFALLYIARSHLVEQEYTWQRERVAYDPQLRLSVLRAGVIVAVIVLGLAWAAPSAAAVPRMLASWREFSKPMRVVRGEWKRLFSTLYGGPPPRAVEPFGRSLTLGGSRHLADTLVMDIEAPRGNRYYWRGAVYGHYGDNKWTSLEQERIQIIPGKQAPNMEQYELRQPITQTVTRYIPGQRTLVGASQFRTVDRDAEGFVDLTVDVPLEYVRVFSIVPLDAGEQYRVTSQVSTVDKTSLRDASTDYPEWVTQRYLQLPPALPHRVRMLAEAITAEADTAFDKVVAIERYLRLNITYNLDPPLTPEGHDYVDFLLFDSQEDYCNGYASAMAVMARSVGIPARVAVGYAQGEYDPGLGVFRVRKENAHTWPEVYFPQYGWLEFEPTASETPLVRPEGAPDQVSEDDLRTPPWMEEEFQFDMSLYPFAGTDAADDWEIEPIVPERNAPLWIGAVVLGLAALAGVVWWALENVGLWGMSPVERAYARLQRFGGWLGRPPRVSDTPSEWAGTVTAAAPEAGEPISRIVDLYVQARFARGDMTDPEARAAWRRARPALVRGWLRRIVSPALRHAA
jgi:transglutaminase-like putative cysteine protease